MRTQSSILSCAPLLLALFVGAYAQQANQTGLGGRVVDARGAGVPGAIVTLYARAPVITAVRLTTTTDAEGNYRFDRPAPGEYLLEADARGFAPTTAQAVRVERDRTASLNVTLEAAGVRAEVFVTASDTAQAVDELSKATTTVTREEIDARDESSIAEALRLVPGLRVQQLGGPGTLTTIKTRGLRNQDTAVLIDGLRFRDPTTITGDASSFLSDLQVTNLSRLEILRGSGSSLYGTNAIGGVVNLVTDEGGGPARGDVLLEGGSLGMLRGRARIAGGAGVNRLLYSAGVSHLNVTRGIDGDDAARSTNAQGRILFRLTPTATLSGRVYTSDAFVQLNDDPQAFPNGATPTSGIINAVPFARRDLRRYETGTRLSEINFGSANFVPAANDPDNSQATRFFNGAITFAQRPTEGFGYSVSYQGLRTRRTFRDGPGRPGNLTDFTFFEPDGSTSNHFDGTIHTLNGRTDFRLGAHNFVNAGYEFERESFANRTFAASAADNSAVNVTQRSHALFAQDQVRLFDDRLQLSAAFRAQFFALDQPRFTPSTNPLYQGAFAAPPTAYTGDGSIAYLFRAAGTKLRAHVGNGYRAPSLYERFGTFFSGFSGTFSALGDPRLRPERSIGFDAGVDQSLARNRVRLSASYFYTRLQEVVGFGDVGTSDPFSRFFGGYLNTRGGLARGAEFSVEATPTASLDLTIAYTYTNSDERRPRLANVIRSFGIPDHQFSVVATQRVGRRVMFNFDFFAASDYLAPVFDPNSFASLVYRFDGAVKADAGASYTVPMSESRRLRFFGYVDNLFGRDNYENGFRTPGRTGRAGAQFSF